MSMPVVANTAPAADTALAIRNLAEYVDSRLAALQVNVKAFDTGEVVANADGSISTALPAGLASIAGVIHGPGNVTKSGAPNWDLLWVPTLRRDDTVNNALWFTCYNGPGPAGRRNVGITQRAIGLCWGPAAAVQDAPAPAALPPGSLFPAGVTTSRKLRYPGTADPQYRTPEYIGNLADDVGAALGGSGAALTVATWSGSVSAPNGSFTVNLGSKLSRIDGAVATALDETGGYRQTRILKYTGNYGVPAYSYVGFAVYTNQTAYPPVGQPPTDTSWAPKSYKGSLSVSIVAWGAPA